MQDEISERLRYWRKEKRLTQQQVADKIGKDRTSYVKYESGTSTPSLNLTRVEPDTVFDFNATA